MRADPIEYNGVKVNVKTTPVGMAYLEIYAGGNAPPLGWSDVRRIVRRQKWMRRLKITALYTVAGAIFLLGQFSLFNMELPGRWVISFCFGYVMGDMTSSVRRLL